MNKEKSVQVILTCALKFFHHRIGIKIYIYGFFKRCFAEFALRGSK